MLFGDGLKGKNASHGVLREKLLEAGNDPRVLSAQFSEARGVALYIADPAIFADAVKNDTKSRPLYSAANKAKHGEPAKVAKPAKPAGTTNEIEDFVRSHCEHDLAALERLLRAASAMLAVNARATNSKAVGAIADELKKAAA